MDFFSEQIQNALTDIIKAGILSIKDLKERIFKCITQLPQTESLYILENFFQSDTSSISDREQFLYDSFLDHISPMRSAAANLLTINPGAQDHSDRSKIDELLVRTGYSLTISSEIRKYGGPPPEWTGEAPDDLDPKKIPRVFISGLKTDIYEDKIIPELERFGKIYQSKLLISNGVSKGELIVDFSKIEEAQACIKELAVKPFLGTYVFAKLSGELLKLYLIGVPKKVPEMQLEREILRVFPHAKDVTVLSLITPQGTKKERTATVEFKSFAEAEQAKFNLENGKIVIFGSKVKKVDWKPGVDEYVDGSPAKIVSVNLGKSKLTHQKIKNFFEAFGKIKTLIKNNTQVSIEYESAASAETATVNGFVMIDNEKIEVKMSEVKKNEIKSHIMEKPMAKNPKFLEKRREFLTKGKKDNKYPDEYNSSHLNKSGYDTRDRLITGTVKPLFDPGYGSDPYGTQYQTPYDDPYAAPYGNDRNSYYQKNPNKLNPLGSQDYSYLTQKRLRTRDDVHHDDYHREDSREKYGGFHNQPVEYFTQEYEGPYSKESFLDSRDYYTDYPQDDFQKDFPPKEYEKKDESNFDISKYGRPTLFSQPPPPPQIFSHQPPPIGHFPPKENRGYDYHPPVVHDWSQQDEAPFPPVMPFERGSEKRKLSSDAYRYPPVDQKMREEKYSGQPRLRTSVPTQQVSSLNVPYGMNPRGGAGQAGGAFKYDSRDPYQMGPGFGY